MKKKVAGRADQATETNQPIKDNRFLPVMKHPNQICWTPNDALPTLTVWDRINIENAHDKQTRHKRQSFDSVRAELNQLDGRKVRFILNPQTGEYPETHSHKNFYMPVALTVIFRAQLHPEA